MLIVKLVISIFKYHREMLTDQDCEKIYELVYCSHRAVAQAAGEYYNQSFIKFQEFKQTLFHFQVSF